MIACSPSKLEFQILLPAFEIRSLVSVENKKNDFSDDRIYN